MSENLDFIPEIGCVKLNLYSLAIRMNRNTANYIGADKLLCPYTELQCEQSGCGMICKKYKFKPTYGNGNYVCISFDGLTVMTINSYLKKDLRNEGHFITNRLELSYLLEGESVIRIDSDAQNRIFVHEGQESYIVYLDQFSGSIEYHMRHFKELKIRISDEFLNKHHLKEHYAIQTKFGMDNIKQHFASPLCSETRKIVNEVFEYQKDGIKKRLFLEAKVLELLTLKLTEAENNFERSPKQGTVLKKIYHVQEIVKSNLTENYTVTQLARFAGINESTLKKEYKRNFNVTLSQHCKDIKMDRAKYLLNNSDNSIVDISQAVGYLNATHFSAAFKKHFGVTPLKFRQGVRVQDS